MGRMKALYIEIRSTTSIKHILPLTEITKVLEKKDGLGSFARTMLKVEGVLGKVQKSINKGTKVCNIISGLYKLYYVHKNKKSSP